MHSEDKQALNHLTAHLFRENAGKMTAVLVRLYGIDNLDTITDAIQDTFESALLKWRYSGVPENPSAWLIKVARNKTINVLKRNARSVTVLPSDRTNNTEPEVVFSENEITDSQLRLLLACCRLDLTSQKKMMLTLNVLCGFGVREIANALLLSDEAVKKALYRSKSELKNKKQQFENPEKEDIRKYSVMLHTFVYLLFNEGYKTTSDAAGINIDLCYEAIRLAKLIREQDTSNPEINGLLALLFFTIARFPARITTTGEWLTLAEQDRSLWNPTFIAEGFYYLDQAKPKQQLNTYYLEALIASLHCTASSFDHTDWSAIVYLYEQLERLQPESILIRLNRIVAEMHIHITSEQFEAIDQIETAFGKENRFVWLTTKAYAYERLGDLIVARYWYNEALPFAKTTMDRAFILKKTA
ncbi:MAG: sigma-70 family RNA polymerase sigma factor [Flavobacterium sp.]|jgi:RNA polymerase sigma-70 factor (ECF subfamily)|nr:sigma-70 family RNA polymerase sigma factor [Flavobacterium sp.]HRB72025.1 sigma-70 family RNA polymerase sigma factor [Flavobacterium sp.]